MLPTTASLTVSTDVKGAAMEATEALIQMMGGEGKIVNVLEVLEDANTVLRKEGVEEVVAKYPDVEIVQEISGMKSVEEAIEKIENAISANIDEINGIIATGFTTTVGIAQTLEGSMRATRTRRSMLSASIRIQRSSKLSKRASWMRQWPESIRPWISVLSAA